METKVVHFHVAEMASARCKELVAAWRQLGVGERPSGEAVDWLARNGLYELAPPQYLRQLRRLSAAICASIPPDQRTVQRIDDWLAAHKVALSKA